MTENINQFLQATKKSLQNNSFVKLNLSNYKGKEENLLRIYAKRILIKKEEKLSFTYHYKTRDIQKNYSQLEAFVLLESLIGEEGFRFAALFTTSFDLDLDYIKVGNFSLKKKTASITSLPSASHDKQKNRIIEAKGRHYLQELKITDENGNVLKNAQDKYKQINHFLEIVSSLLKELPQRDVTKVVDMGAGKGYLTFALYDYLNNVLHKSAHVTGVELRKELVEQCNIIAKNSKFEHLHFEEGSITNYINTSINVLMALHACDTATDDAIFKGISCNADLIVTAPCCHKQIRRQMEQHKTENEVSVLTRHGIFMERQAEMVTDGIRALILEYYGYSTKVFEFISDAHTPKMS